MNNRKKIYFENSFISSVSWQQSENCLTVLGGIFNVVVILDAILLFLNKVMLA